MTSTIELWSPAPFGVGSIQVRDHLGGFDADYRNPVFDKLTGTVYTEYLVDERVANNYPNLQIKFDAELMINNNTLIRCATLAQHPPPKQAKHFLCSFNRNFHKSRHWLVERLLYEDWFDVNYCSCGFADDIKIGFDEPNNWTSVNTDVCRNYRALNPLIQDCFVQIVSETAGESYVPFPTEKCLFPIANKTLWVAYAQPGWYDWVEKHMGFQKFDCFDYSFDSILDPHQRLDALIAMLKPFQSADWDSIYKQQQHTLDYNFKLLTSQTFIKNLKTFDQANGNTKIKHPVGLAK